MIAQIAAATEQLLDVLKYALLALLYLFFARVLWAVWSEVRGPRSSRRAPAAATHPHAPQVRASDPTIAAAAPAAASAPPPAAPARRAVKGKHGEIGRLVIYQPKARRGSAYPIGPEITIGRAPSCSIGMPDDTFVSQLHARVFQRDGGVWVEDLGSTNGSFLNGRRLSTVEQLARGDRLQIGNTIFEAE